MKAEARKLVRNRADDRCEYCRLPQKAVDATFHVDHVIARQHIDDEEHDLSCLALACDRCNLHKGTNISSVDPDTRRVVTLFNPRQDEWSEHFRFEEAIVEGLTATGRATVRLLNMNAKHRIQIRKWLIEESGGEGFV